MKKLFILTLVCLLGSVVISMASPTASVFQLRLVLDAPSKNSERLTQIIRQDGQTVKQVLEVQKTVLLDQTALKSATASIDALTQPIIEISLNGAGAKKFAEITKQNLHKRIAIVIDGQLLEAPVVQSEISGGQIQISGRFSKSETEALAKKISAAIKK